MADTTFPDGIREKFNSYFSDTPEGDKDRYGFITPGDILAADGTPDEKAESIHRYLENAPSIDLDGDPKTQDVFVHMDRSKIALSIRDGNEMKPVFSMDTHDIDDCFMMYPSDHYALPIEGETCFLIREVGQAAYAPNISMQKRDFFNGYFSNISDNDNSGLITPADILAGTGRGEEKAIAIRDYLKKAPAIEIDHNLNTWDAFAYRDGATIAFSLAAWHQSGMQPLFSMDIHDTDNCFMTDPVAKQTVGIESDQCRLIRAAHPAIEGLVAEYLKPETWITLGDEKILLRESELSEFNRKLIERANRAFKEQVQDDTPPRMWDVFDLPKKATYKDVLGEKRSVERLPFIRKSGETPIEELTVEKIEAILKSMNLPGKINVTGEKVELIYDESFLNRKIRPRYGYIVNRTDMRGVPSDEALLWYATDDDHWQWTALSQEQPVAIVHSTTDKNGTKWHFVLHTKVWGWVKAHDIAFTTEKEAKRRWTNRSVLTSVSPKVVVDGRLIEMGTKFRLIGGKPVDGHYKVAVSIKRADGKLGETAMKIPAGMVSSDLSSASFYKGIVPFSRANMTRLLFRYLGTPWAMANERRGDDITFPHKGGNRKLYIDCSGIMEKALDAMGIYAISRTSKIQVRQGKTLWEKTMPGSPNIKKALDANQAGTWLIGMPGHVMFYLGKRNGTHWMLHSPGHFRKYDSEGNYRRIGDGMAVVSPVDLSNLVDRFDILMSLP